MRTLSFSFLSLSLLLLPSFAFAEIYKCNRTYQNKPCSETSEALKLPTVSSYRVETPRYALKAGEVEQATTTETAVRNVSKRVVRTPLSGEQKLRELERDASSLRSQSSRMLRERGEEEVYAQARKMLLAVDRLCTIDFEKKSLSLDNRCERLRRDLAMVSRTATARRVRNQPSS